jgi:hypothetical protein
MKIVLSRAFRIIQSFVSCVGEARRPVRTPAESEETPGTRKNLQSAVTEPINHKMRLFPLNGLSDNSELLCDIKMHLLDFDFSLTL